MDIGKLLISIAVTLTYMGLRIGSAVGSVEGSRLKKYLLPMQLAAVALGLLPLVLVVYSFFTAPDSPFTLARPYLTVAAVVGLAALVGKFALSVAIVPFLKAIPSAVAGIIVKIGWDKWQTRKPREPKPQS